MVRSAAVLRGMKREGVETMEDLTGFVLCSRCGCYRRVELSACDECPRVDAYRAENTVGAEDSASCLDDPELDLA
jgi:hypothetical protein